MKNQTKKLLRIKKYKKAHNIWKNNVAEIKRKSFRLPLTCSQLPFKLTVKGLQRRVTNLFLQYFPKKST